MERRCENCAHRDEFLGYDRNYQHIMKIRCWEEPNVCDHPMCISMDEAKSYTCENHMFQEEKDEMLYEKDKVEYVELKKKMNNLLEKHPEFKKL